MVGLYIAKLFTALSLLGIVREKMLLLTIKKNLQLLRKLITPLLKKVIVII